jgi:hypothetical protein
VEFGRLPSPFWPLSQWERSKKKIRRGDRTGYGEYHLSFRLTCSIALLLLEFLPEQ